MSATLSRSIHHLQRCQVTLNRGTKHFVSVSVKPFSTVLGGGGNLENNSRRFGLLGEGVGQHNLIKIIQNLNGTPLAFSTEAATSATTTTTTTTSGTTAVDIEISSPPGPTAEKEKERKPSILTQLPPDFTPGHAWALLQPTYAGGMMVRFDDFKALCLSSRPRTPKDAKVIRTALLDLKRCNHFKCTVPNSQVAMEGMIRSLCSDEENGESTSPEYKIKAGIFVGEAFVDERTGLYVGVTTDVVDNTVLKSLWDGVNEFEPVSADNDNDQDENGDEEDGKKSSPVDEAARVAKATVDVLFKRASNPTKDMKKRAKRKYLRTVQTCGGPSPLSIDYAVKICLKSAANGNDDGLRMARSIMHEYWTKKFLGTPMEETIAVLRDFEDKKRAADEEAKAAEDADAADEGEGEGGEEEENDEKAEK